MERVEIAADTRDVRGKKVKVLRSQGLVPAVLYGRDVDGGVPIQVNAKEISKALARGGANQLISLKVGKKKPALVLARHVQRDPLKHSLIHIDFLQVVMSEKIEVEIPIELVGESPAARNLGCVVIQSLDTLAVQCLPSDIVQSIEVDVSSLQDYNEMILVGDLKLPEGFDLLAEPDTVIVKAEAPRSEEELEALAEPVAVAAEVERVGRVAEEEEELEAEESEE